MHTDNIQFVNDVSLGFVYVSARAKVASLLDGFIENQAN